LANITIRLPEDSRTKAAYLKCIYELIEELSLYSETDLETIHNRSFKNFQRTRVIKIFGSETMISYFKLRLARYNYYVEKLSGGYILDEQDGLLTTANC
jgi:hypothetical protein